MEFFFLSLCLFGGDVEGGEEVLDDTSSGSLFKHCYTVSLILGVCVMSSICRIPPQARFVQAYSRNNFLF